MRLERKIRFSPAFDKRSSDPSKDYGIHGAELHFELKGPDGGVTYTLFTNWMLPHVQAEQDAKELLREPHLRYMFHKPQTAGLDGHWKKPQYEGQSPVKNCVVTGGDCYCDGTSLTGDVFSALVTEGDEAVWKILEDRYETWRPK